MLDSRIRRMGVFCLAVAAGVCFSRAVSVGLHLPRDGRRAWRGGDLGADGLRSLEVAVVLGWIVGVDEDDRAAWLLDRRRGLSFFTLALVVSVSFSAVSDQASLQGDLTDLSYWSTVGIASLACSATVLSGLLASQFCTAWFTLSRVAFAAYAGMMLAMTATYSLAVSLALLAVRDGTDVRAPHLHHLYIGLVLAATSRFNRVHSGVLLAVGVGLFCQGVGAYGFAGVVNEPAACRLITIPGGTSGMWASLIGCSLDSGPASASVELTFQVCPTDGASMQIARSLVSCRS